MDIISSSTTRFAIPKNPLSKHKGSFYIFFEYITSRFGLPQNPLFETAMKSLSLLALELWAKNFTVSNKKGRQSAILNMTSAISPLDLAYPKTASLKLKLIDNLYWFWRYGENVEKFEHEFHISKRTGARPATYSVMM